MGHWLGQLIRHLRRQEKPVPPTARVTPRRLPEAVRHAPGKWVAIVDDEVVAVRETPDALLEELHRKGLRGAAIMRAPSEQDVELVGLG